MVAFGLVLALVGLGGGALVAWLALQSSVGVTLQGAGMAVTVLPITLFSAGAAAVALLWVGWRVLVVGVRRRRAQRAEIKALRTTSAGAERNGAGADAATANVAPSASAAGPNAPASNAAGPNAPASTGSSITGSSTTGSGATGSGVTASSAPTGSQTAQPASGEATSGRTGERQVRGPMD